MISDQCQTHTHTHTLISDCVVRKKKKVARRPLDMARLESIQKFLSLPPKKIARHSSLHNIKRAVERELRVPQ